MNLLWAGSGTACILVIAIIYFLFFERRKNKHQSAYHRNRHTQSQFQESKEKVRTFRIAQIFMLLLGGIAIFGVLFFSLDSFELTAPPTNAGHKVVIESITVQIDPEKIAIVSPDQTGTLSMLAILRTMLIAAVIASAMALFFYFLKGLLSSLFKTLRRDFSNFREETSKDARWGRYVTVASAVLGALLSVFGVAAYEPFQTDGPPKIISKDPQLIILPGPTLPSTLTVSEPLGDAISITFFNTEDESVSDAESQNLRKLATTLSMCSTETKPAEIIVMGFASTTEYRDENGITDDYRNKNRILANKRAYNVSKSLQSAVREDTFFSISPHEWSSYGQMHNNLRLVDRPGDETGQTGIEIYNQIAVAYLKSGGACAQK